MKKLEIQKLHDIVNKDAFIKKLIFKWSLEVEFSFLSNFKHTSFIRNIILIIWKLTSLNNICKNRLILIIDELVNNAIEYWSKEWETNKLRIIIKKKKGLVYFNIEIEDTGNWKKHHTAEEMEQIREKKLNIWFDWYNSIRWRWLFMIITNLVEKLYFKDTKSWWLIVWVEKTIINDNC